jgi:hypothetical protein
VSPSTSINLFSNTSWLELFVRKSNRLCQPSTYSIEKDYGKTPPLIIVREQLSYPESLITRRTHRDHGSDPQPRLCRRILCATARPVALQCQIFNLRMSVVPSIIGAPGSLNVQTPFLLGGPQFPYVQDMRPLLWA